MRRLSIIGSTGSIGTQALEVVESLPDDFQVVALTARRSAALLAEQARQFQVAAVAIVEDEAAGELRELLAGSGVEVLSGWEGLLAVAGRDDVDLCLNGMVGGAGMGPPGFKSAMPGFGENLKDDEIWAVLAFIKSRWPREVLARQRQITARGQ
ncbi:MAG: hypothetical protein IH994_07690 [Proteobacteria bacterium]|nr:hypothetical protein [Pseudomonadota bacterium]